MKLKYPHLLGNNTSHGVNGLCEDTQPGCEIWNCDQLPAQRRTTMVSPITQPNPSRTAEIIRWSQKGKLPVHKLPTICTKWKSVPGARGTLFNESSASVKMVGTVNPERKPAVSEFSLSSAITLTNPPSTDTKESNQYRWNRKNKLNAWFNHWLLLADATVYRWPIRLQKESPKGQWLTSNDPLREAVCQTSLPCTICNPICAKQKSSNGTV